MNFQETQQHGPVCVCVCVYETEIERERAHRATVILYVRLSFASVMAFYYSTSQKFGHTYSIKGFFIFTILYIVE